MILKFILSVLMMTGLFLMLLLCNAGLNFFPYFYPETKKVLGRYLFGYKWKTHLTHILLFPVASSALAWVCQMIQRGIA